MNNIDFLKEIPNDSALETLTSVENWIFKNKKSIEFDLEKCGAILFSGLPITNASEFDHFVSSFQYEAFTYEDSLSNAVRINKTDKVFTANEAPKEIEIFLHHEMAQTPTYPKNIFFFCKSASSAGGQTPLCRSDKLYEEILKEDPALINKFIEHGVIYHSTMSNGDELVSGQGRSWQKTLGVFSKDEAESKLRNLGYSWNWIEGDNLSVTTRAFEAIKELKDGKKSFFNQVLAASLGWKKNSEDDVTPVRFGNGKEISLSSIQLISEFADNSTLLRHWEDRDILLIDNYRVMHGRKPFEGNIEREVLVSLSA